MKPIRSKNGHRENPLYCHHYSVFDMNCEQFEQLKARARGCCEICGTSEKDVYRETLVIDHCHSTGVIRGLLCHRCNQVMSCIDGRKSWGPTSRFWEGEAKAYALLPPPWGEVPGAPLARSHYRP